MSSTETMGIIAGALALVVAVTLLVGLKKYLDTIDGTVFVALLLLPLIVYAVGSGRLEQFSAPGGWGATFRDTANATVRTQKLKELKEFWGKGRGDYVEKQGWATMPGEKKSDSKVADKCADMLIEASK